MVLIYVFFSLASCVLEFLLNVVPLILSWLLWLKYVYIYPPSITRLKHQDIKLWGDSYMC